MKFSNLVNLLLVASIGASGCSAPVSQTKKQNYLPTGTPVYSLPASYADSTKIESYPDSLTLRQITRDLGKDTFYSVDNFSVKKSLAKELNLPKRFPEGAYTEIIENKYVPVSKKNQLEAKAKPASCKKTEPKWYNSNWFKILAPTIIMSGAYIIYENSNKPNEKTEGIIYGGRTDIGSEIGEVRGERDDNSEAGGNR